MKSLSIYHITIYGTSFSSKTKYFYAVNTLDTTLNECRKILYDS